MHHFSTGLALGCLLALALVGCVQSKTGGAGSGGAGSGGTAGSGGATSSCGVHDPFRLKLSADTIGPSCTGPDTCEPFDGPAVVERSTKDELILAFDPDAASGPSAADAAISSDASPPDAGTSSDASAPDAQAGDAAPAGPTMRHVTIRGLDPMPVIAAGTELWLTKDPAGNPADLTYILSKWAISARVGQGGPLLFGASFLAAPDDPAMPVKIGAVTPYCSGLDPDHCGKLTTTFSKVEILGDAPVTIADSQSATVTIKGADYDVSVHAFGKTTGTMNCADYVAPEGVALEVQALDMPALLKGAKLGPLPACSVGSDPDPDVSVETTGTYQGPVYYAGIGSNGSLAFSAPGHGNVAWVSTNAMPTPKLGQQFWLSAPDLQDKGLLESQGGPLVVAIGRGAAWLSKVFGVPLTLENQCQYASSDPPSPIFWLRDMTVGTSPPVTLQSGTLTKFKLGARAYNAWLSPPGPNNTYSLEVFSAP